MLFISILQMRAHLGKNLRLWLRYREVTELEMERIQHDMVSYAGNNEEEFGTQGKL